MRRADVPVMLAMLVPLLGSCRTPTQLRVVVSNEAACSAKVVVRSGRTLATLGEVVAEAGTCGGATDDLVFVPAGDSDGPFAIEIATRTTGDPRACSAGAAGCIVQRWSLHYRPHERRTFTTRLTLACVDARCPDGTTCVGDAVCVPSDTNDDAPPNDGPPAFVDAAADAPFEAEAATDALVDTALVDTAPAAPPTVRLVNGSSDSAGTLDLCVKTATETIGPLLSAKSKPLGGWEVSGPLPLPDDTGDAVSLVLSVRNPATCSGDGTVSFVAARPPPGGQLLVYRRNAFEAAGTVIEVGSPTPSVVALRGFHAGVGIASRAVEFNPKHTGGMDEWPSVLSGIAQGTLSPAWVTSRADVDFISARATDWYGETGSFAPLTAGHAYIVFAMAEELPGPSRVRVCDEHLTSVDQRALCR